MKKLRRRFVKRRLGSTDSKARKLNGVSPQELKTVLLELEGTPPNYLELTQAMLNNLGSPDPVLRDQLIYRRLAGWLYEGTLSEAETKDVLNVLQDDEHLFYKLGETNTDSVLLRSFSVLLIAPILGRHRETPFLSKEDVLAVFERARDYLEREQDLRGYDRQKGWLHAVAHAADVLDELALCEELGEAELLGLLESIQKAVFTGLTVYAHGEDERLSNAVVSVFKRSLISKEQSATWLQTFKPEALRFLENAPLPESYHTFINVKHFLRTLYFSFLKDFSFLSADSPEIKLRRVMLADIEQVMLELGKL